MVPDEVRDAVAGVEALIIDGLRDKPHPTHLTVAGAVEAARAIGARQAFITHLTHEKNHVDREKDLPPGIRATYDGMRLEFELS
jgi:phosphoribosyl 1,2-cyclic phosphate phosphodiesterase